MPDVTFSPLLLRPVTQLNRSQGRSTSWDVTKSPIFPVALPSPDISRPDRELYLFRRQARELAVELPGELRRRLICQLSPGCLPVAVPADRARLARDCGQTTPTTPAADRQFRAGKSLTTNQLADFPGSSYMVSLQYPICGVVGSNRVARSRNCWRSSRILSMETPPGTGVLSAQGGRVVQIERSPRSLTHRTTPTRSAFVFPSSRVTSTR